MKSFRQFITETPFVDTNLHKSGFHNLKNSITNELGKLHEKSEKIADTDVGSLHHVDLLGMHGYYHHVNGKPREFSLVTQSNIQRQIDKNGGDGKYIKQMMKHHAKKFGEIKSDEQQSVGGMKFWKSLYHEKDPDFSFHHYKKIGEDGEKEIHEKHKIDDDYLQRNKNVIWNYQNLNDGKNHRIVMKPNE